MTSGWLLATIGLVGLVLLVPFAIYAITVEGTVSRSRESLHEAISLGGVAFVLVFFIAGGVFGLVHTRQTDDRIAASCVKAGGSYSIDSGLCFSNKVIIKLPEENK